MERIIINNLLSERQDFVRIVADIEIEFLLASGSYAIGGLAVVTPTCKIVWQKALDNSVLDNSVDARGLQGVGDCDGDGIPDITFYYLDGRIACYDGRTGDIKWQVEGLKSHGSMSGGHFTSADIDSDGRDEFLYPLGSNEIIVLDNDAPKPFQNRGKLIFSDRNGITVSPPQISPPKIEAATR